MKCAMEKSFAAYDAGPDCRVKLKPLMYGFQDVVAEHSKASACGIEWLLSQQKVWVMHRIYIHIRCRPVMGEPLTFVTWHKGDKGYRAFRDYEIWSGSEKQVSAASLWLFIDLEKNRILRVPKESREWYSIEMENALEVDMDRFEPVKKDAYPAFETMTLRSSDLDPIGHVNNAVYLDLLETAVDRRFCGRQKIETVMVQFHKEISQGIDKVQVGIQEDKERFKFDVVSDAGIHAFGDFTVVKSV